MSEVILAGFVMGVVATLAMDIWALILQRFAGMPLPNWSLVGRWVAHLPKGRVMHTDIGTAEAVAGEMALGWVFHYAVGIIYGIVLAAIMGPEWLAAPSFLPAWIFALLTVGFGWFLLQPGLGLGIAASATPHPWQVRGMNLVAHTFFGIGLWIGALL